MKTKRLATFGLLTLSLALAGPAHALDAQPKTPPAQSEPAKAERAPRGAVVGSPAEDKRYAMREAASPDAKNYKGGDVVVISVTTAVIVLLAVVILILVL
jgi:hypothetical protein